MTARLRAIVNGLFVPRPYVMDMLAVRFWCLVGGSALGLVLWGRCDTVAPEAGERLVVEAFVEAGEPLPTIRLWRTRDLDDAYPYDTTTAVADADLALRLGAERIAYRPVEGFPGRYRPRDPSARRVNERTSVELEAGWGLQRASAETTVPPALHIDEIQVEIPDAPVDGIILDSLFFDPAQLDSLRLDSLQTGAQQGLVYLVEVTLAWHAEFLEIGPDSVYWVRTQLKPYLPDIPTFDDFFFRPEQVRRERGLERDASGRHTWTGVYAVPVETPDDPLPPHRLRVSLIRSGADYARYVSSRNDPERREPVSNVSGAIGIVAGLALDSLSVRVE